MRVDCINLCELWCSYQTSGSYVVCTTRRPPVSWALSSDPSSSKTPTKTEEPQQVFIGIFPASHIHVRDELADAEGRLPDFAASLQNGGHASGNTTAIDQWKLDKGSTAMDTLKEEEEEAEQMKKSFRLGPPPDQANSSRAGLPVYPASIRSVSPDSQVMKPLPPRPSLKSGDDTASGAAQPIIDEIASALREWHTLMFQYLARRDYKLFHTVRDHIEALHLGRRQLLAQTLSTEETVNLRRDCVARLVSGNIVQGLDVIVRHPTWGALVTVDVEGESDPRSWVSAVRMYAMQTSLAYMNVSQDSKNPTIGPSLDYTSVGPLPTPANSAFPDYARTKGHVRSLGSLAPVAERPSTAKFYHIFLDIRAFVASPCAPGETAELFFSLYNKAETRFVTEEFCVILNHNGVLARDPSARMRTLFTDLAQSDVQDALFLVCRIVRNGALKIANSISSGIPSDARRGSEASVKGDPNSTSPGWTVTGEISPGYNANTPVSPRGTFSADAPPAQFRRPFGCAVLELAQLSKMAADESDISSTREHTMPIFVPTNEALFSMLHQDIIANNSKEYEKSPRYTSFVRFFRSLPIDDLLAEPRCWQSQSKYSVGTQRPSFEKTLRFCRTRRLLSDLVSLTLSSQET